MYEKSIKCMIQGIKNIFINRTILRRSSSYLIIITSHYMPEYFKSRFIVTMVTMHLALST